MKKLIAKIAFARYQNRIGASRVVDEYVKSKLRTDWASLFLGRHWSLRDVYKEIPDAILDYEEISKVSIAPNAAQNTNLKLYTDRRVPLGYIKRYVDFNGSRIRVAPPVLIPRSATEQFVSLYIEPMLWPDMVVLDMCTGSGCIAANLTHKVETWACDISSTALRLCKLNAPMANVIKWDVLEDVPVNLKHRFDMIVSNPPYIRPSVYRNLPGNLRWWEDRKALEYNDTGMMQRILENSKTLLNPNGSKVVALEVGDDRRQRELRRLLGKMEHIDLRRIRIDRVNFSIIQF